MIAHFAIALLLASSAAASTTDSAQTTSTEKPKKERAKKICKTDPRTTGTRISKQVCKTEQEWAIKEDAQDLQTKGKAGNPEPVCMMCNQDPF